jgi:hypothetical protein
LYSVSILQSPLSSRPITSSYVLQSCLLIGTETTFLNPFQNQVLLSFFERMITAGQEHRMLTIQHRCLGNIPAWTSKQFYHNQVVRAPISPDKKATLTTVRSFVHEQLGVPRPTNRYAVDLLGSRSQQENGGTSSYNEHEIQHVMNDVRRIRAHPALQGMTIGILSFYKAQVTRFKAECYNLAGITVVDGSAFSLNSSSKSTATTTMATRTPCPALCRASGAFTVWPTGMAKSLPPAPAATTTVSGI